MSYDIGDAVDITTAVTVGGVPTNATMSLLVAFPDLTVVTYNAATSPAVTSTGTGAYKLTLIATMVGDYVYRWTASVGATGVDEGQFTVRASGQRLISLQQAKQQLGITTTADDEELRDYVDSLTSDIEHMCGPMIRRTVIETVWVDGGPVVLSHPPVIAVTAITAAQSGWTAPLLADLAVDGEAGLVYSQTRAAFHGRFTVTYTAGRNPVPPAVNIAARGILQHQWSTQHNTGGGRPQFGPAEDLVTVPGMGFAIPRWTEEKLRPYLRVGAVA